MTTLIAVYNSDGCVGRCDARCYNAETVKCDCICGGKNHGVGEGKARENVEAYTKDQVRQIERGGGYVPDEIKQRILC